MNKIPNRQAICETLMEHAKTDRDIIVLCSDSRGSASLTPFFDAYPEQSVEVGIAEQDLVGIAAGLASCGKKAWCASPASFVSTRSYEQCKVDVAYSNTNVKIIGISGGVSYGVLNDGMSMCGVSEFWQKVIKGAVIILAVVIDQFQRNLQAKMALQVRNENK